MKKLLTCFALCAVVMSFSSCMTKQLAYFQNVDTVDLKKGVPLPVIRIKSHDRLNVTVSSTNPEYLSPFSGGSSASSSGSSSSSGYLVDADGYIKFPVLGKIKVKGLTRPEVENLITERLSPYFSASEPPVVEVKLSFKVTMLGEAGSRVLTVDDERLTIIEALAQGGDLSIYGKRRNILLIREMDNGEKMTARYNINDANILNSEFYFLQQNDIVYVEPRKTKALSADVSSYLFWTPLTSLALSLASIITSLAK